MKFIRPSQTLNYTNQIYVFNHVEQLPNRFSNYLAAIQKLAEKQKITTWDFPQPNVIEHLIYVPTSATTIDIQKSLKKFSSSFLTYNQATTTIQVEVQNGYTAHQGYDILCALGFSAYQLGKEFEQQPSFYIHNDPSISNNTIYAANAYLEGLFCTLHLVNLPVNAKSPNDVLQLVKSSFTSEYVDIKSMDREECNDADLHAYLSVGRTGGRPSQFITLTYQPTTFSKTVLLVGKTVTFDTGGISIKPSQNMHYMKSDLGGGATVLGIMKAAILLQLPIKLVAILPATDNLVGEHSLLPGEVIASHAGKTIEVIDTDAEGRLTLADGLSYGITAYKPDVVIDMATLTGSAIRTFGTCCAAVMSNNDALYNSINQLAQQCGEKIWMLPLWDEYKENLKSDVADLKNFSGQLHAGAIDAGVFLKEFIHNHPSWIHFDVAGMAFGSVHYAKDKAATGWGIQLILEYLKTITT